MQSQPRTLRESDLLPSFNAMTIVRAREYERSRHVLRAEVGAEGWILGRVRGSEAKPYDQVIILGLDENEKVVVEGECTCPVAQNCKHVAAVLFHLLRSNGLKLDVQDAALPHELSATSPQLESWLSEVEQAALPQNEFEPEVAQRLLYLLLPATASNRKNAVIRLISSRLLKNATWGAQSRFSTAGIPKGEYAKYLRPVDRTLLRELYFGLPEEGGMDSSMRLTGPSASRLLQQILETERCFLREPGSHPLQLGPTRPGRPMWQADPGGCQTFQLDAAGALVLPMAPPWYVDEASNLCGPLAVDLPASVVERLLLGPSILPEHSERARKSLGHILSKQDLFLPKVLEKPRILHIPPVVCFEAVRATSRSLWSGTSARLPYGRLYFKYGSLEASGPGAELRGENADGPMVIPRDAAVERQALERLIRFGWTYSAHFGWTVPPEQRGKYVLLPPVHEAPHEIEQLYYQFIHRGAPALRKEGWEVHVEEEGSVVDVGSSPLLIEAKNGPLDWFNLELGVLVGDQRVELRPLLLKALETITTRRASSDEGELYYRTPEGQILTIPLSRIRPALQSLMELFGRPETWPNELHVSKARANEMLVLEEIPGLALELPDKLKQLAHAFSDKQRFQATSPPKGFRGELREYQLDGVSWLRFLADFQLGGILADDMGLGKTVQTLAHILDLRERGELNAPALIVAPTSTLPNWEAEAARFAPDLKVLTLHGPKRKEGFASIPEHDVVLTSYALMARDQNELKRYEYSVAVLDEAQNIKNHTTNAAKAAFGLLANHRIALSGTPVENRLEELWSIFRFASPGLLGSMADFKREFWTPIEKQSDKQAQNRLSRRIRPFVLRRKKEQVAKELPPKTIIVDRVELEGDQRDLYESLRLAMDKRVRTLVSSKGLEKSRIEVLDALLKLRQACCDPRLVKLPSAASVTSSAKLERLLEMVDQLVSEGRRALIFSQFTSMLDLIEPAFKERGHTWVRISGDTEDRKTPVELFQKGDVPLFLISLRAGGTGLNLTAADTVIHYDPWWNPAVENQATDRAHRIGQDKPVFVYKMVATGTVEEKILELQERKADLAERLLSGTAESLTSLTTQDLEWILS